MNYWQKMDLSLISAVYVPVGPIQRRDNSFIVKATKLFNVLPKSIRDVSGCELGTFKQALDEYLATLPDKPAVTGFSIESNSLLDVVPATARRMYGGLQPLQLSSMIAVS